LLGFVVHASARADTQTSTPAKKPTHIATVPAQKSKHHASAYGSTKNSASHSGAHASNHASNHSSSHASSHTSARNSTYSSGAKSKNGRGKKGFKPVAKKHGQQAIDADRAREIQTALIREHYMDGEPSGSWDSTSQAAMQRYQADQGWQSKTTPDSRALIKLGLGPSHDHLLNPESAMTAAPGDPKPTAKPAPPQNNLPQQ
jgi:hypothetical protein